MKVWVVKWNEPSKFKLIPKVMNWHTYKTEAEARKAYKEASKIKNATDLTIEETECCSL
jgi:hypothetical protein